MRVRKDFGNHLFSTVMYSIGGDQFCGRRERKLVPVQAGSDRVNQLAKDE